MGGYKICMPTLHSYIANYPLSLPAYLPISLPTYPPTDLPALVCNYTRCAYKYTCTYAYGSHYGRAFLLQWRKGTKGRRQVRERSKYIYMTRCMWYSFHAWQLTFIQPLNKNFGIFSEERVLVLELKHPPLLSWNMSFKKHVCRQEIRERFAEGSQKVGERRVYPDSTLAKNWSSLSCNVAAAKPFKLFSTCVSVVGQSVRQTSSLELKVMFPTQSSCKPSVRNVHTQTW